METVRTVLNFLLICLEVLLIFNLIIVVHELGHFLAGRWRGLVIEKFGIWFGKPLWKKTVNGVQYSLGSIPCGGFVALPQMAPMDAVEGESETPRSQLPPISALDKIIVALAGPLFSLGLALVFAVIVWSVGRPVSQAEATTTIGYVTKGSPAEKAGLQAGDEILEVDGQPVKRFGGMSQSVVWQVVRSEGRTIAFKVRRKAPDGSEEIRTFFPEPKRAETVSWFKRKSLRQVLIEPMATPTVAEVKAGSPADKAGLRKEDAITAINGQKMLRSSGVTDYEEANPGQPLTLSVERDKKPLSLPMPAQATSAHVEEVSRGGPAEKAGLQKDDTVTEFNGEKVWGATKLIESIKSTGGKPFTLTLKRGEKTFPCTLATRQPENGGDPIIGVSVSTKTPDGLQYYDGGPVTLAHPLPFEQVSSSVSQVVNTIGAVISPRSGVSLQHLSGPVMILRTYYMLLDSEYGWRLALWFSVILNVNLALLNMLPIPVLDGGHILLALIEAVRRKPVSLRILEVVQTACFLMIAGYMLYVTFYDVVDSPFSRKQGGASEVKFAAESPTPSPGPEARP